MNNYREISIAITLALLFWIGLMVCFSQDHKLDSVMGISYFKDTTTANKYRFPKIDGMTILTKGDTLWVWRRKWEYKAQLKQKP